MTAAGRRAAAPGRPRWRGASASADRGSIAVELAFAVPAILLVFGLVFAYGRVAQVNGTLEAGTRDAARAATLARSHDEAVRRATAAVRGAMVGSKDCLASLSVTLSPGFEPGDPVTVVSTCTYSLADIGLPGGVGRISPRSTFTSMLDPNRGVQ